MDTETEVSTTKHMKFPKKIFNKTFFLARRNFLRFSNDFLHNSWTSFVGHAPAEEASYYQSEPRDCPSNNIIIMIIIISRAIIGYNIISFAP
jgi:hypothetical protein